MTEFNEPWTEDNKKWAGYGIETRILDATGEIVLTDGMDYNGGELQVPLIPYDEKIRRIVACVNACAGIPTDCLERVDPKKNYHCQFDIEKSCMQISEFINE